MDHVRDVQQALDPFDAEERQLEDFKHLEGTVHRDDANFLLYKTTRVGTWRNPVTKDRVIVGWRAPVLPEGIGVEEQQPIHIADILQMTQDTPGQIEKAPPGRDSDQASGPRLATRSDQSTGQSRQPVTAQYEPGSEPSDALSIAPDASLAQASPDVSRATGSGWHHTIGTKCCPTVSSSGVYGAPSWTHVSLL